MKILITGICGFVGSSITQFLLERHDGLSIVGIDNLMRPGSETNRGRLRKMGISFVHGDMRSASDFESLPSAEWVIDAAANPSVLAGVVGQFSSRQLFEHNLGSLVNVLEYCKARSSGLLLLSSSRVYSISALCSLPLKSCGHAFQLDAAAAPLPNGVSAAGIDATFSTQAPISLYGSMKLASETVALEYGAAFDFPVLVSRCGVLAGAGQFGTAGQGIFSYWINAHLRKRPLRYIGFDGTGKQVRDVLHPRDLAGLLDAQMRSGHSSAQPICAVGGGVASAMSLAMLTAWCDARFGKHEPEPEPRERTFDVPWIVMDNSAAERDFGWHPVTPLNDLLEEIACHAEDHPDWLDRSAA